MNQGGGAQAGHRGAPHTHMQQCSAVQCKLHTIKVTPTLTHNIQMGSHTEPLAVFCQPQRRVFQRAGGRGGQGCPERGGKRKRFITPTETNVHGDALCFMVMGPSLLQRLAVGGWRLAAVGGWWELAVGGGWWRLAVSGRWSLGTVLQGCPSHKKKNLGSSGQPWGRGIGDMY